MKKIVSLLLSVALLCCIFSGCSKTEASPDSVRVFALKGPTGMGMAKLISDAAAENSASPYTITVASSPDAVAAEILKGEYDIAAVPTNLAAVLYQKTEGTLMIGAVNTLGVLYILENGNSIKSLADLNGKTIYATGQASTPEYILNYILQTNNIDCEVIYLAEHAELAAQMSAGDVKIAMLPVPNATTVLASNPDVRIALNCTEEWEKASAKDENDGALYQGCVVIRREFAEKYPETVEKFLADYETSVKFVNENSDEASVMIEQAGIIPKAAVAKKAIPDANIVFISGDEMIKGLTGFYKVLYDFNPSAVGGSLPDENIFYKK